MTPTLILGDPAHSSWSLRAWLLFDAFGLPVRCEWVDFAARDVAGQLAGAAPARTVPALRLPSGTVVWDSLAIAEEVAARHPDAGLWPTDPDARAVARSLAAEMHSGFAALRAACPMNLRNAYRGFEAPAEVTADLDRIARIWAFALDRSGGPWLCGAYSAADAAFAPVAARIEGWDLPVPAAARAYADAHLAHLPFRRWRAMGLTQGARLPWYEADLPEGSWRGPAPIPARPVETGAPVNAACPFSGRPVRHLMEARGRIVGFCNAGCRDKAAADPEAWPEVAALLRG